MFLLDPGPVRYEASTLEEKVHEYSENQCDLNFSGEKFIPQKRSSKCVKSNVTQNGKIKEMFCIKYS